jgi:ABC-type Fe3+-citrate transport system substrate-binding protein
MLEWHILGMKDAEIEVDGKKVSTQKGEVEIIFKANLIKDYEKRWEDKPFWKFLRSVYEKYVVRETVDEYEDDVEDEAKEMISEFKAFLNIPGR